jgi:hypothetical protein
MTQANAIYAVTTRPHQYTFWNHFNTPWGKRTEPLIQQLSYRDLFNMEVLPAGHYIFSDIERLGSAQATALAKTWEALDKSGRGLQLLNHPTRTKRRYELLRTLYEEGINPFNVYRVIDLRKPERYPVFIRSASEHDGAMSGLLKNETELDDALREIYENNICREDLMIVEFCDTADSEGIYRKYSVFRLGDKLISRHQLTSKSWMLKHTDLIDSKYLEEEMTFMDTRHHHDQVMEAFELGHIEYGRIDYSLQQGKLCIWEINTNPMLSSPDDGSGGARCPAHEKFSESFHQAVMELAAKNAPDAEVVNA